MNRKPTIYEALADKLGRAPTNSEINAECRRIIGKSADSDAPPEIIALHEAHDARSVERSN